MAMFPGMGGTNPRQLAMMMRKLGIDVEEIDGVEEVVVKTKTHEYRFTKAQVSIMKAQGSETWQIVGKPTKTERGTGTPSGTAAGGQPGGAGKATTAPARTASIAESSADTEGAEAPVTITDEDVKLVMKETGKDAATARKALEAAGGDLAEAIVRLS